MRGFITREDMDAQRWYRTKHPIKLGKKESKLKRSLRFLGLNPRLPYTSNEKILRLYRTDQTKAELREKNSVYDIFPSWLKGVGKYVVDGLNKSRINSRVRGLEKNDEIVEGVIMRIPYGR